MGYTSDVAIGFEFESREKCLAFFAAQRLRTPTELQGELALYRVYPSPRTDSEACVAIMSLHDVKWYEDYPDVAIHERMLASVGDYDEDSALVCGALLLRIGEDDDDIERRTYGDVDRLWDFMGITRSIETPEENEGDTIATILPAAPL